MLCLQAISAEGIEARVPFLSRREDGSRAEAPEGLAPVSVEQTLLPYAFEGTVLSTTLGLVDDRLNLPDK